MLSTLLSLVVLALGLMLCHKWNPFLGSVVCSVLAFYGVKKVLQGRLDGIIEKFSRASAAKCRLPEDAFILPDNTVQFLSHLYDLLTGQEAAGTDSQSGRTCLALPTRGEEGDEERHHTSDCVTAEVKAFVDNIKSRYIDSWYNAVSSDQDFPRELEFIIEDVLRALYLRLGSLDPCDLLEQMVPVAHTHYRKYKACLTAVERTKRDSCGESCDALRTEAIRKRFPLKHVAFESEASEQYYLRGITSVLVKLLEPPHLLASPATNALVIDILTNNVLVPTVDLLCEPKWLSLAVLYLISMEEDAEVLATKSHDAAEHGRAAGDCLCKGEQPQLNTDAPAASVEGGSGDQSSSAMQDQRSSPALPYQGSSASSQRSSKESGSDYLSLPDVYVGTQDNSVKIFGAKDVEKAVEAEVFLGSLVFSDICITRTESRSVPGKGVHTVYCIKYEACKNSDGAAAPATEVRKVWRRFREFLELQGSLESNPQLRKHLKGIRGPSRGLGSVLSDKKNVQERLMFLQHYLKQLCSREAIVNSKEFHKFLDYSEDSEAQPQPLVEMRRQGSSSRLDRVLVQGVKSTLELLKTALPGDDHSILSPLSPLDGSMVLLSDYLPSDLEYSFSEINRPQQLQQCMYNFLDNFDQASSPEFSPPLTPSSLPLPQDHSPSTTSHKSSQGSSTPEVHFPPSEQDVVPLWRGNAPQTPFERVAESLHLDLPLCASAVDFVVDSLEDGHACKSARLVLFVELLLGRALERTLREQFTALFGVANCTIYLHKLHESLWGSEARAEVFTEAQVTRGLTKFVPVWAQLVFGVDNVCQAARTLAKSIQIRDVNKCLVYQLVDILVDSLLAQDNCDARLEDNA